MKVDLELRRCNCFRFLTKLQIKLLLEQFKGRSGCRRMEQYKIIILESRNADLLGECNWISGPTECPLEALVINVMCDQASVDFSLACPAWVRVSPGLGCCRVLIGSVRDGCGRASKVSCQDDDDDNDVL